MRTITPLPYNVYTFDELPPEIQDKVISNNAYTNVEHQWWDTIVEHDALAIGLKITEFDIDYRVGIKGHFINQPLEVAKAILKEHGEHCSTYKTAFDFRREYESLAEKISLARNSDTVSEDDLIALSDQFLKDLLEDYLSLLRKDYDYLTSKEAIRETITANECEFKEDGSPC